MVSSNWGCGKGRGREGLSGGVALPSSPCSNGSNKNTETHTVSLHIKLSNALGFLEQLFCFQIALFF